MNSKKFGPEELKKHHKGKYDNWQFSQNGKGEWVGVRKNQTGIIVSKTDDDGKKYPELQIRELTSTGGVGGSVWIEGFKNFRKSKNNS